MTKPRQCKFVDPDTGERCTEVFYGIAKVKGLCNYHAMMHQKQNPKPRKSIPKRSKKKEYFIALSTEYYLKRLEYELKTRRTIDCFNCRTHLACSLEEAQTRWVAHLFSGNSHPKYYFVRENSIILCWTCHQQLDHGIGGNPQDLERYSEIFDMKEELWEMIDEYLWLPHNQYFEQKRIPAVNKSKSLDENIF